MGHDKVSFSSSSCKHQKKKKRFWSEDGKEDIWSNICGSRLRCTRFRFGALQSWCKCLLVWFVHWNAIAAYSGYFEWLVEMKRSTEELVFAKFRLVSWRTFRETLQRNTSSTKSSVLLKLQDGSVRSLFYSQHGFYMRNWDHWNCLCRNKRNGGSFVWPNGGRWK